MPLKCIPNRQIYNNATQVQIMVRHQKGDTPLSELMVTYTLRQK